MHGDKFKYPFRAMIASNLKIISALSVEVLCIYFMYTASTVFAVITLFVKLKIVALFSTFFVEPYKSTSMAATIGRNYKIDRFRAEKIVLTTAQVMKIKDEIELEKKQAEGELTLPASSSNHNKIMPAEITPKKPEDPNTDILAQLNALRRDLSQAKEDIKADRSMI